MSNRDAALFSMFTLFATLEMNLGCFQELSFSQCIRDLPPLFTLKAVPNKACQIIGAEYLE